MLRVSARFLCAFAALALGLYAAPHAGAQADFEPPFDAGWYDATLPHLKLDVVTDGVYRVPAAQLQSAAAAAGLGVPDPSTLRLIENGRPVPLHLEADGALVFVGQRNTGKGEAWAYQGRPELQSSARYSLYTDTTTYWLTWGGPPGPRYASTGAADFAAGATPRLALRDTIRFEPDSPGVYHPGDQLPQSGHPLYTRGEGYYWTRLYRTAPGESSVPTTIGLPWLYRASPDPLAVRARLNGASGSDHDVRLEADLGSPAAARLLDRQTWFGRAFRDLSGTFSTADVPSGDQVVLRLTSSLASQTVDLVYADYVEVAYPRVLGAGGDRLRLPAPAGRSRFRLVGFSGEPAAFSPSTGRRIASEADGGAFFFAEDLDRGAPIWAVGPAGYLTPAAVRGVPTQAGLADASNAADYLVISAPGLMGTAERLADYRRDRDGYTARVVSSRRVFDQFDYGRPTPLALRRFIRATQDWATPPRFVVLVGDATYRFRTEPPPDWELPSYGNAVSDAWLAMQTDGTLDFTEPVALGRLPIRTEAEMDLFLRKLDGVETSAPADWHKRALFLSGGITDGEQAQFDGFIQRWATDAAAPPAGADTTTISKTSDEILDTSLQDSIRVALEAGNSWLTYFGHSAADTWELVTDPPAEFGNEGRLPVVVSLGCRTGNFAAVADRQILAEQLLFAGEAGAIAHWGSSELGYVDWSRLLGDLANEVVFEDFEALGDTARIIGLAFQEAKRRYAARSIAFTDGDLYLKHLLQYGLIGDPATRMPYPTRPDLAVAASDVRVTPPVPVPADSVLVAAVTVRNRGTFPTDSVDVRLRHERPTRGDTLLTARVAPFALSREVAFRLPLTPADVGTHRLEATADPANAIAEFDETNNASGVVTHTVFANGLATVHPLDFGTAPLQPVLRAALALQADGEGPPTALFEIDRDPSFASAAVQRSGPVPVANGYADWTPSAPLTAGLPYYWRVRLAGDDSADAWAEARFTAGPAPEAEFVQDGALFAAAETDAFVTYDAEADAWAFTDYRVNVLTHAEGVDTSFKGQYTVNSGSPILRLQFGYGVLVLDGQTGRVRGFGSATPYAAGQEEAAVDSLETLLFDLPEPGDYVFVRTRNLFTSGPLAKGLVDLLRDFGSAAVDTLRYEDLHLVVKRAGQPGTFWERAVAGGPEAPDFITLDTTLTFSYPEGVATSPPVGPSRGWDRLEWSASAASGGVALDVLGTGGAVLLDGVPPGTADLSGISHEAHPTLRLRARFADESQAATPQLDRWAVAFDPVPELVLDPDLLVLPSDSLQEGATLTFTVPVRNLSFAPSDSVRVTVTVTDQENRAREVLDTWIPPVPADAVAEVPATADTRGLVGQNTVAARAEQAAPEKLTYNNVAVSGFAVQPDRARPLLRVLVDGEPLENDPDRVLNTQAYGIPYVSATPTIEVTLEDENAFLPLTDPAAVRLTLDGQPVPPAQLQFEPGVDGRPARVVFEPGTLADTLHTLTVRATDASGNPALIGNPDYDLAADSLAQLTEYQVHFRVASAPALFTAYPYPNPMSRETRFLLRSATDLRAYDDLRIRIYTVAGRLVRELDVLRGDGVEGGLGANWNGVRWDGQDEDGDPVASGVYLYRVLARADGSEVKVQGGHEIERIAVIR